MTIASRRDDALERPVHDDRTAAVLGICLAVCFSVCFLTGLYSHFLQQPPDWLVWPSRPASLYRVTQGVHVATGIATVPLLLAKLWSVYPRLFRRPIVVNPAHAIERLMLVPLVCGAVFMLFSGIANVSRWYPWGFYFPGAHYAVAWITVGALIVHIGAKASTARKALTRTPASSTHAVADRPDKLDGPDGLDAPDSPDGRGGNLGRRGFLGAVAAATGLVTLTTAGQTVTPLRPFTLFAQRRPDIGSQGLPVNKSAVQAGVVSTADDDGYRLRVRGDVVHELELTVAQLDAMARREAELPIACVEGWSAVARWRGVPVHSLLAAAGADLDRDVRVSVESLQEGGRFRASELNDRQARDLDTMLAVAINGEPLNLDHGYPCRLIGPNRPGVLQTKWVSELVVMT